MKVVLRRDVAGLGREGDVKDVADGYARNYLMPRGLAAPATAGQLASVKERKAAEQRQVARLDSEQRALVERIEAEPLLLRARAGAQGRLHGSVTGTQIAEALSLALEREIDKRAVELVDPIKHLGSHAVQVRLAPRVAARLTVVVEPEE